MEITKKKVLAALAAVAVILAGTTTVNNCPWLRKQWDAHVAPVLFETTAPVTSQSQ